MAQSTERIGQQRVADFTEVYHLRVAQSTERICHQRVADPTEVHHMRHTTPTTPSRLITAGATPGGTDRELLSIRGRCVGSYIEPKWLRMCRSKLVPTSTNHTAASRLLTESYSRCNRPGATPDRFFRLQLITRLHRGCSPRATPGATDRELLPIVFFDFQESQDCIVAAHRELLPVQQTGSYSRSFTDV